MVNVPLTRLRLVVMAQQDVWVPLNEEQFESDQIHPRIQQSGLPVNGQLAAVKQKLKRTNQIVCGRLWNSQ